MKQVTAPITSIAEVAPDTYLVWLESPDIARAAKPGRFVMVRCGPDTLLRRPISVHQVDGQTIALLFAAVGKGTGWLSRRKTGDNVDLFGPLGNGFSISPSAKKLLLIAGGLGIAPLSFLANMALRQGCAVQLHQGVDSEGQVLLDPLRDHYTLVPSAPAKGRYGIPHFPDVSTLDCSASTAIPGAFWPTGLATMCIPGYAAWADQVFACGPLPMYRAMAQMAELREKPVQVSLEIMMGCGFGVCYGCTVKTRHGLKQVCKDGPVFDLRDILWDEMSF